MFDLRVWVDVEADGATLTKTPGKGKDSSKNQMQRLAKLAKKHRNGQIPKVRQKKRTNDLNEKLIIPKIFRSIGWID